MMDDETRWQDAALHADQLIGPPQPEPVDATGLVDFDELETGIASIFAALQAAGDGARSAEEGGDSAFDDAMTYQLLGELDRLWQRPSP